MPTWQVRFAATVDLAVTVTVDDEEAAEEAARVRAEEYLATVGGDCRGVVASVSLDGIGSYSVTEED